MWSTSKKSSLRGPVFPVSFERAGTVYSYCSFVTNIPRTACDYDYLRVCACTAQVSVFTHFSLLCAVREENVKGRKTKNAVSFFKEKMSQRMQEAAAGLLPTDSSCVERNCGWSALLLLLLRGGRFRRPGIYEL